jgi:hypothetical protein
LSPMASWANFGNAAGGIATAVLAVLAILGGAYGLRDWRAKVRAQKALADEETYDRRLERQRLLYGWTPGMAGVYSVEPVTEETAMNRARDELIQGQGSEYAILRVKGGALQAHQFRELVAQGHVGRPPTVGEKDGLNRWVASQHSGGKWVEPPAALVPEGTKRPWWKLRRVMWVDPGAA